jgi:N-acylneuraminate cytidylyltransferase
MESDYVEPYNMPRQELPATFWQTGHIDVIQKGTILNGSMSGEVIFPLHIDPLFSVDLDNSLDWERAEEHLKTIRTRIVLPGDTKDLFPEIISLLVLDFDGVLTDDRVFVNEKGQETVAAHRGDGMGISMLKKAGIEVVILSRETNPVVKARGEKLNVPVYQGVTEKGEILRSLIEERNLPPEQVVYLGNDVNDLPCFPLVGLGVAVADAHPALAQEAQLVLDNKGGFGAVRELCDMLLSKVKP